MPGAKLPALPLGSRHSYTRVVFSQGLFVPSPVLLDSHTLCSSGPHNVQIRSLSRISDRGGKPSIPSTSAQPVTTIGSRAVKTEQESGKTTFREWSLSGPECRLRQDTECRDSGMAISGPGRLRSGLWLPFLV